MPWEGNGGPAPRSPGGARTYARAWLVAHVVALAGIVVGAASAQTQVITTVAGTGAAGYNGDGIPATAAQLGVPFDVERTADGGYVLTEQGNQRVRKVSADGTITTVAGTGATGGGGDGGPRRALSSTSRTPSPYCRTAASSSRTPGTTACA